MSVPRFVTIGVAAAMTLAMAAAQAASAQQAQEAPQPQPQAAPEPAPDPGAAHADEAPLDLKDRGAQNNPGVGEITEKLIAAVALGLEYLRKQQNTDGSFGRDQFGKNVAITALAAIAFMADGHLPGRGEYGQEVARALEFILLSIDETGLIAADNAQGPMYGHGFATLFLGEVYGMNPADRRVHDALVKAVGLIVGTQNEEGGWRYNPIPNDADISVTITQVMALRSARNAGIKVPKTTIDRAVEYVKRCQNPDGGFKYMAAAGGSAWPRTAAGVATLFYAGVHEDEAITRGLDYLTRTALPGPGRQPNQAHYFYGQYYAVQAMYLAGGDHWDRWWPAVREELIARQSSNGGWFDNHAGQAYATAMSLIVLQMPKRYLPIFQR
jgi:Prenyltransferase and squalene oxidase repeat